MNTTQEQQIKEAKRAYVITLNNPATANVTRRFQVYLDTGEGLNVLWPENAEKGKKANLLPTQVYSKLPKYPAYHFAMSGYGYDKLDELRTMLKVFNPEIEVQAISGWSPNSR